MAMSDPMSRSLRVNEGGSGAISSRRGPTSSLLRAAGSLWYASVLLMLLLVAMACATVYESTAGTERALQEMYYAWWFQVLLALLAVNVLAALIVRYPFTRRRIGFVVTHASILVTLAGALVTDRFGVNNGQVGLAEGQTATHFTIPIDTLTVKNRTNGSESTVDLASRDFGRFNVVDQPSAPLLTRDDLQVEVVKYLPDSEVTEQVVDDNPHVRHAIEVSLSESGRALPIWAFANKPTRLGMHDLVYRVVENEEEFARLASGQPSEAAATFSLPLSQCIDKPVPLGDTGYTAHVLRYLPHANVGADNKLRNVSDKPVNPAIEIELNGPLGKEKRFAFSRFPDFGSMHGGQKTGAIKVTFVAPTASDGVVKIEYDKDHGGTAAIEVLAGPDGKVQVRFTPKPNRVLTQELAIGTPVESPWPLQRFAVLRRFEHARIDSSVVPVEPREKARIPAVLLKLSTTEHSSDMWVQKFRTLPVTVGGTPYEVSYANKSVPLGFSLKLNRFHLGYYPGGTRPRSFESHVTFVDPTSGGNQSRVISMNNPAKYGGYKLFQSRYRIDGQRKVTFLSVARDPGQPIVFAGYIGMMGGICIVLVTRTKERGRGRTLAGRRTGTGRKAAPAAVSLGMETETRSHGRSGAKGADSRPVAAVAQETGKH